jgi:membrane-associated protease RseP (regulator of RpoE activity)
LSEEEFKRFEFHYGVVFFRTKRFGALMDRLGGSRMSKPAGWFLLFVLPVIAGLGLFLFLSEFLVLFSPTAHEVAVSIKGVTPLAYLGLPGINPYLPIVDGWLALVFAMIVHEGAHGIVARSLGLPVKASGLLFFLVVPIGAFVDVDESAIRQAKARDSGRVLAAGAGVNFLFGVLFLLLLFSVVSTMTPAAHGVAISSVYTPSPAYSAGIRAGDYITAVNGAPLDSTAAVSQAAWYKVGETVNMTFWTPSGTDRASLTIGANPDNSSQPFIGVVGMGYSDLQSTVSTYTGSLLTRPVLYLCIPTFPNCESLAPFSSSLAPFYTSSYGGRLVPVATFLYWLFFLNINLAIFNALPIYPLDGGQAFRVGLDGLAGSGWVGGRLTEKARARITYGVTLLVLVLILALPLAAYTGAV